MKNLARIVAAAFALSLMTVGAASAAPVKAKAQVRVKTRVSGQKARSAIMRNRTRRGKSNLHLKVRRTQELNKMSEFTASNGKGKVTKYQVSADGKYARQGGGKVTQSQARKKANGEFHRENGPKKGQFSGVRNSGTTARGNYEFRSKTNPKERVVVDANSGKVRNYDRRK